MRILLVTSGTRGDIQPIIALTVALRQAGHVVLLCGPPNAADMARSYDCLFYAVGNDIEAFVAKVPDPTRNPLQATKALKYFIQGEIAHQFQDLPAIANGCDLILGTAYVYGVPTIAELVGASYGYIAFFPQAIPSGDYPAPFVKNHSYPRWVNKLSWWFFSKMFDISFKRFINQRRRSLGLGPVDCVWSHTIGNRVLMACDNILAEVPDDISPTCRQTGYLQLSQSGQLEPDLEAFLAAGSPPIYVGFGSMKTHDRDTTTHLILEAARKAKLRVLLSRGWARLNQLDGLADSFLVGNVPHSILFPRVAAVVHHGGAGTTATAARAGIPQIIVPHIADQFYWGKRISHLMLGPPPIWRSRLTVDNLAQAMSEAVANPIFLQCARATADKLTKHDSAGNAVKVIESEFFVKKR